MDGTDRLTLAIRFPQHSLVWFRGPDNQRNDDHNMLGLEMVDLEDPTQSTLLTKPLLEGAVQPVEGFGDVLGIWHGEGKMGPDAPAAMVDLYQFKHYVECRGGKQSDQRPQDVTPTSHVQLGVHAIGTPNSPCIQ